MSVQAFDFSVDLLRAILWQYNDAARLQGLLERKAAWYAENHAGFWTDWVADVFDLRTANDFGLAVWAIILDVPLAITASPDDPGKPVWGFGPYRNNFNNGNFATTSGAGLTTAQKRLVLRLRYFQLTTRATVPEINAFMAYLFADLGPVYVLDGLDMTAHYIFAFPIDSKLATVLSDYDLLPRPAGVLVRFSNPTVRDVFGFGLYHVNFNRGNFYRSDIAPNALVIGGQPVLVDGLQILFN